MILLSVAIAPAALAARASAEVAVLPVAADTTLNEASPDNNLGAHAQILVGGDGPGRLRRGLLRFDVAAGVPAGAVIDSATLYIAATAANQNTGGFELYRMLADWGEGTGSGPMGSPAAPGEATWNSRFHAAAAWAAPGGLAGADFAAAASSSVIVSTAGEYGFTGLGPDVQGMLDDPASNFGWLLFSVLEGTPQTARQFEASETASGAPPRLEIAYTLVPEPGTIVSAAVGVAAMGILAARRRRIKDRGWRIKD